VEIKFCKINKGGYFNLSNAILKKFSLFDFVVASESAEIYLLNGADLALLCKKNEDLYITIKSHAILYQVDGMKYDFERFKKKRSENSFDMKNRANLNMWRFFNNLNRDELQSMTVFKIIDDLYNLRRTRFIN
jgi:hypothetical protein